MLFRRYILPGNKPIDGPSAGVAIAVSVFSAVYNICVPPNVAITGEISISGSIRAVGGIKAKVWAAKCAGAKTVIVPAENLIEAKKVINIDVLGVNHISEVINVCFRKKNTSTKETSVLSAKGV